MRAFPISLSRHPLRGLISVWMWMALIGTGTAWADDPAPDTSTDDQPTVLELLKRQGDCGAFLKAAELAGLNDRLAGDAPITVLAWKDDTLRDDQAERIGRVARGERIISAAVSSLADHILPGRSTRSQILDQVWIPSIQGAEWYAFQRAEKSMLASLSDNGVLAGAVAIVEADLTARNGIVHIVERLGISGLMNRGGMLSADFCRSILEFTRSRAEARQRRGDLLGAATVLQEMLEHIDEETTETQQILENVRRANIDLRCARPGMVPIPAATGTVVRDGLDKARRIDDLPQRIKALEAVIAEALKTLPLPSRDRGRRRGSSANLRRTDPGR